MELLPADRIHLLSNDLFNLADDPPTEREIAVDPGSKLHHQGRPQDELVVVGVGLRRNLTEGLPEELGVTHARLLNGTAAFVV